LFYLFVILHNYLSKLIYSYSMKTLNTTAKRMNRIIFKRLIRSLFVFVTFVLLTGCAEYQYVSIDSNLYKNENKEFFFNNDTVSIKYSFSGENFLILASIYNKLNIPLYIDWSRTNVVLNGDQLNDSFYHEQQISYIAPQSFVSILSNPLQTKFVDINTKESMSNINIIKGAEGNWTKYSFSEENTPLYFRSIIALTPNENLTSPNYIDNSFWFSEVFQTNERQSKSVYNPSNQFYIRKSSGFGKVLGWTTGIAATLVLLSFPNTGE